MDGRTEIESGVEVSPRHAGSGGTDQVIYNPSSAAGTTINTAGG